MKILQGLAGVSVLVGGLLSMAAAQAGPLGLWSTEDDQGRVQISQCADSLCGDLVWLEEALDEQGEPRLDVHNPEESLRSRPLEGLRIVWDMQPAGDGKTWKDGRVYDPESGKVYQGRITLEEQDVLKLRGFVGAPMFGRTSTWTRVEQAPE